VSPVARENPVIYGAALRAATSLPIEPDGDAHDRPGCPGCPPWEQAD
jgi:hypothetical protein